MLSHDTKELSSYNRVPIWPECLKYLLPDHRGRTTLLRPEGTVMLAVGVGEEASIPSVGRTKNQNQRENELTDRDW